jgi:hypothetical protein
MSPRTLRRGVGAVITAGAIVGLSGGAALATTTGPTGSTGVTGTPPAAFTTAQHKLEADLASRVVRLGHLESDVTGAQGLQPVHASVLSARIASEQASLNALVAKVPGDTTRAQLNVDRAAMLTDNRVYAVMTPQVFETISADAASAQLAALTANETSLAAEVASLSGQPGYQNALSHDRSYVARVGKWTTTLSSLVTSVLAQQPSNFPGDTHFFVRANHTILDANVAAAYANYDASVIALATGGYTGS